MIATAGNHLRMIGEGSLIVLLYGLFFWRLRKSKPRNRLVECGYLTLIVFLAIVLVGDPADAPGWLFGTWLALLVLHCLATLFFLFQRMFRASVQRS